MTDKVYMMLCFLMAIGSLSINMWGGWAGKTYDKTKNKKRLGFWLRFFGKAETKENYLKMLRVTSAFGILVVMILMIICLYRWDES